MAKSIYYSSVTPPKKPKNSKKKKLALVSLAGLLVFSGAIYSCSNNSEEPLVTQSPSPSGTVATASPSPSATPGKVKTIVPEITEDPSVSPGTVFTAQPDEEQEAQDYSHITESPYSGTSATSSSTEIEAKGKNYLLVGSDSRSGNNSSVSGDSVEGQRSDTAMIVHVSEDGSWSEVISIPRDTMVAIPECTLSDGSKTSYKPVAMLNSAFASGDTLETAIECTKNTVELNTGLPIDGYASVDFSGLENIVDALGGIEVTVPERMVSSKAGLDVQAGRQTMDGATALAYARARTLEVGNSDGSDLSRISRQHQVIDGIKGKLASLDAVLHPIRTYKAIQEIRNNTYLSGDLENFLTSADLVMKLTSSDVTYSTAETVPYTYDYNRLMFTQGALNKFSNLRVDSQE